MRPSVTKGLPFDIRNRIEKIVVELELNSKIQDDSIAERVGERLANFYRIGRADGYEKGYREGTANGLGY